ncbi:putative membrane protein YdfK [Jeotgalicoccus aerolatus]|uniref:Membrane protein YqgA involved in biofilm formation n=1 Tax=Jeotgalicoccus aerolatus TaxID=709510 RepID=A0ABS4HPZ6_9STAP|nr:DUF554 domain-containing protein [Jeotgalicoccus aerolatus]MBP1953007.1 putative membrane protein YqgA involved in biofilm formation [Jeotgalicoccus aerolatus]GGE01772.1 putative membrane protein YdfK [Jeotgalicoccus aerolatus]CAD2073118.1 putative membrane protein YdfK [Jeotgalicoccus aerolatus]
MIGTIFNVIMILVGSTIGSLFKKGIKKEYHDVLMTAMGLVALSIGVNAIVQYMPTSTYPVLFIVSLALGGVIGQMLNLEDKFNSAVSKYSKGDLAQGLSTAILLYCIGTLSILGPVEAAVNQNYTYLITNGILDGITSIVLASTFGFGIALSAVAVFLWQGAIYVMALFMENAINTDIMNEVNIIGGILILMSGLGILNIKAFKTMNYLPALAVVPVMFVIFRFFS